VPGYTLAFLGNIRLGWNWPDVTDAQVFKAAVLTGAAKRFIATAPAPPKERHSEKKRPCPALIRAPCGIHGAATVSITTFSIMTLSIMKLNITAFSIMTLSIMTLSLTTFSVMTLSITTLSIKTLSITINKMRHSA
jgi:hypothetical protein